jgi:nitrite reductase/ring-hydroxylating ferredoxin subunit
VGAILSGLTDFKDTAPGSATRDVTTLHAVINLVATVGFALSLAQRIGGDHDAAFWGFLVGYLLTPVLAAAELPEETPTKAMFGATAVMLVRRGDVVHALKDTCSHAGGPLSQGKLSGDTIECPWHFSVFRLADGSVVHGPASSRQVSYRARINGDQIELQGPYD